MVTPMTEKSEHDGSFAAFRMYADIFFKHWRIIAALAVVGVLVSLGVSALWTPKYQASTTMYVSVRANQSVTTGALLEGSNFAHDSMTSFMDLSTTAIVTDRVAQDLNIASDELVDMVEVESPEASVLLKFVATARTPELAATVANSTADVFIDVVRNELAITPQGEENPVQVRVVDSATVPEDPVSPHLLTNSLIGLLGGLFVGIGVVALREIFDTRFHSAQELEEPGRYPVLGRIPFDAQISTQPLIIHGNPPGPRAEAFRMLRTNVQFLQPGSSSNTFMVTSASPGEGKTHVAANLALVLAASGARVVLIEADLRSPRLSPVMGIEGAVGLTDVLIHRAELKDVLHPWGRYELSVLPAGQLPPNPSELLGSASMRKLLDELESDAEYVIIDAPPLLPVTDAAVISTLVSGTLLVAAVEQTKRQELEHAIDVLETIGSPVLGFVINKEQSKISTQYYRSATEHTRVTTNTGPVGSTS